MTPPLQPLISPNADARKISFSPSNASRATAFAMKHGVQTQAGVIEMQMELSDLRKRVKILDGSTGRNELLNQLKESKEENKRAEQQLRTLNDKFHQVQKGLAQIDEEREKLRSTKDQLEKDKKEIQRQLDIREKEVLLLAKRCTSQEEKMKESSKLRASNNELANEMAGLRSSLTLRDEEISQIESLRQELKQCQDSRQELTDRLAKVKKDHDDVVETLNSCFRDIQQLNESKVAVEEERKRDMQRTHLELEKQRLAYARETNELRAEVQLRQDRIVQMEEILRDNMAVSNALRKEKAEWNTAVQLEVSKLKEVHASERNALNRQNDRLVQNVHDEYDAVLDEMRARLEEKDATVSKLEDEVSLYIEKTNSLSNELQALRDKAGAESVAQVETITTVEKERDELADLVSCRDQEIAELSASLTSLEREKTLMASELADVRGRIEELEEENAFIMDLENQLHDVNTSIVEVTEQKNMEMEEYGMTVALLQQELDDERSMWASMEQGLQDKIASLEKKNQRDKVASAHALSEARQVLESIEESSSTTEDALRASLVEVEKERTARAALEKELESLQSTIDESERVSANGKTRIEMLESELSTLREATSRSAQSSEDQISTLQGELQRARERHETEVTSNFRAMEFKEKAIESVQTELRNARESFQQEVSCLQDKLKGEESEVSSLRSQLSKARLTVGAEATASQRVLAEKDLTITSLTDEISALKKEGSARDKAIRESNIQHEERILRISEEVEASRRTLEYEKAERAKESKLKNDALALANATLEDLRISSASEIATGKRQISELSTRISSLETELSMVQSEANKQEAEIETAMVSKEQEIVALKVQVDELKLAACRNNEAEKEALSSKDRELSTLRAQLDESQSRRDGLQKRLVEKDGEIVSLKTELDEASTAWTENEAVHAREVASRNCAVESLKKELEELRETTQSMESSNETTVQEKERTISRLETELSEARQALEIQATERDDALSKCEKSLATTKIELGQARANAETARIIAGETIEQKDAVIESLRSELDESRKALATEKRGSTVSLQAKEESIVSLQSQLAQAQLKSERDKAALKKDVSEKNAALELLRAELDDLKTSRTSDAAIQEKRMEAKDALIEGLKTDLEDTFSRAENDARSFREEIARLKIEVQKTSTNLAIREDELRDLKLIDLTEAEETIASLESQLEKMKQSSVRRDAEVSGNNAKLQSRIAELTTMNDHLQQKITDISQEHNKTLVTLNDEMVALKQARVDAEAHSQELSTKLQERHSSISSLTRKTSLLEQRERTLQSQLASAAEDVRRANEEKEKALTALDFEINRHRANREDDDISFQKMSASLQTDLEDVKSELVAQRERTADVERQLQERTKLLGDMVESNKETEDEKEQALAHITDLQEAVDRFEEENESTKRELAEVRELQQKREDQLLATIHDERHAREVAEADLEAVQARLRSIRHDNRDVNELEKENLVLKDKVRRQEDYLKRKLQKEKVLRDRNTRNVMATPSNNNSRNVMATPRRIPSPTKRRTVPASVGVKTTASMSVMSEGSSFPDEQSWDGGSFRS